MIDPNKPMIDVRTTVTGNQPAVRSGNENSMGEQPSGAVSPSTTGTYTTNAGTSRTSHIATRIPDEFKGSSNQELIDFLERKMEENKPLSKKEIEKIRKRQKAEGIVSGISDAVRAVANLGFTSQYAPNMYKSEDSMSARARARFDREKAERDAKDNEYYNYAITLGKLKGADRDRGLQIWSQEQNLARQDRAYETAKSQAEAEAARKAAMDALQEKLLQGQIDEQDYKNKILKIEADYAEEMNKSKIAKNYYHPPRSSGGGGGRSGGKGNVWYAVDKNGNKHEFTATGRDHAHSIAGANEWKVIGPVITTNTEQKGLTKTTVKTTETGTAGGYKNTKKLGW